MPPKTPRLQVDEKGSRSRSRSRSPGRKAKKGPQAGGDPGITATPSAPLTISTPLKQDVTIKNGKNGVNGVKKEETAKDNDIMNLPSSDFQFMILLTVIAVGVRLFRIYQPSSVVFDEVQ